MDAERKARLDTLAWWTWDAASRAAHVGALTPYMTRGAWCSCKTEHHEARRFEQRLILWEKGPILLAP